MAVRQHEGGSCPDTGMGLLRAFLAGEVIAFRLGGDEDIDLDGGRGLQSFLQTGFKRGFAA